MTTITYFFILSKRDKDMTIMYYNMTYICGMTLRSGRMLTMESSVAPLIIVWDGHDYISDTIFCDFDQEWAEIVHTAMSTTVEWNTLATLDFIKFLHNTSEYWCHKIWSDRVTDGAACVGATIIEFVEDAKYVAECWNKYPNTRMKNEMCETASHESIILMAIEIISNWDLAIRIKNTWCVPSAYDNNENFTPEQMEFY